QAEDGIRDYKVTGVQTCALPIFAFGLEFVDGIFVLFSHVLVDVFLDVSYAEELVEGFESSCDYVEFFAEFFCLNLPSRGEYEGVGADGDPVAGALYEFSVSDFYSYACDFVFEVGVDSYDFAERAPVRVL